jgi:hypothetical protein
MGSVVEPNVVVARKFEESEKGGKENVTTFKKLIKLQAAKGSWNQWRKR